MSKVKRKAASTGVRNVKGNKRLAARAARPKAKAGTGPKPKGKGVRRQAPKRPKPKASSARRATSKVVAKTAPVARFAIKPLDPLRKCGAGTSVQFLFRVDELLEGRSTPHLVYFDHHGWYCDHGQGCPAVAQARKYSRS